VIGSSSRKLTKGERVSGGGLLATGIPSSFKNVSSSRKSVKGERVSDGGLLATGIPSSFKNVSSSSPRVGVDVTNCTGSGLLCIGDRPDVHIAIRNIWVVVVESSLNRDAMLKVLSPTYPTTCFNTPVSSLFFFGAKNSK